MGKKPITAVMAAALDLAIRHGGQLERRTYYGWTYPGAPAVMLGDGLPEWCVSLQTVEALVGRGRMRFTRFKHSRGLRRPLVAEIVE